MTLLERESAVAALQQYAGEAGPGDGRLLLIAGEAGAGKSALLDVPRRAGTADSAAPGWRGRRCS